MRFSERRFELAQNMPSVSILNLNDFSRVAWLLYFDTPSCNTLVKTIKDDKNYIIRYRIQYLGQLNYASSQVYQTKETKWEPRKQCLFFQKAASWARRKAGSRRKYSFVTRPLGHWLSRNKVHRRRTSTNIISPNQDDCNYSDEVPLRGTFSLDSTWTKLRGPSTLLHGLTNE